MSSIQLKDLSEFGRAAVALDRDFMELERLSAEIARVGIDSDTGLSRAQHLLQNFSEYGHRVGDGMEKLAQTLTDARARAEAGTAAVAARAEEIQKRRELVDQLTHRFTVLGDMVSKINTAVSQMPKPQDGQMTPEERTALTNRMPELDNSLGVLVDEARKLKDEAHALNMKGLEKNADSLGQRLASARKRISSVIQH